MGINVALLVLAGAGAVVTAASLVASILPWGDLVDLPIPGRILLLAGAASVLVSVCLAPHRLGRWELLAGGLAAVGGMAALMAPVNPTAVALAIVLIAFAGALWPGKRTFAARVRGPVFAALLLAVGWTLLRAPAAPWAGRVGALAVALSLVAAAGLIPYLPDVDKEEPASSSFVAWTGFFAPALAIFLSFRVLPALAPDQSAIAAFGATLIGLGLLNLGWGTVAAWRTQSDVDAWRYSFVADWGLVLLGIGLMQLDGLAAAYLALLSIVLVRLPLYLFARPALLDGGRGPEGPVTVLVALVLAGAVPFSGFPVRILLLQASTDLAWPLAVPLLAGMVLWVAHCFRLARTVRVPAGRGSVGLWLTIAVSLAIGLLPQALRSVAGL